MKSPAQKLAMKYGSQIRAIRGSVRQLINVSTDLGLKQPVKVVENLRKHLEANAKYQYEHQVKKL